MVGNNNQELTAPTSTLPIVIIGGGDIVRDAHLPAYSMAGFDVCGVFDLDPVRARERAEQAGGVKVYASLEDAASEQDVVFDLATPPQAICSILEQLPCGSGVLIQKPMGRNLQEARRIVEICEQRSLRAAVNFQLRFCPSMLVIRDMIEKGQLGDVVDVEFHINVYTPWEIFPFLKTLERVEILVHSIHYLDLIRSFLGEPKSVYARSVTHPRCKEFAETKTSAILDYGDTLRCCLSVNHGHDFGERHQAATLRVEGTDGCAVATMGVLLDYPRGEADTLEVTTNASDGWEKVPLLGSWFPDAFVGPMSNLQRFVHGEDDSLVSGVSDALRTMALVEACYESDAQGGVRLQ